MPFDLIIAFALLAVSSLVVASLLRNYRRLGKQVIVAKTGFRNVNIASMVFFGISMIFFAYNAISRPQDFATPSMLLLGISIIMLFSTFLLQIFLKKGFFENGIQTNAASLRYSQVSAYYIDERSGSARITFNSNSGLFTGPYVDIEPSQLKQVKALLKKNCSFRNNPVKRG
ncbi:MAG: hypothetical protein FWG30_04025 [Eubacteriaceae bacterium]|nr:hypothetical protein [Eubacteriaceae bacterium]